MSTKASEDGQGPLRRSFLVTHNRPIDDEKSDDDDVEEIKKRLRILVVCMCMYVCMYVYLCISFYIVLR